MPRSVSFLPCRYLPRPGERSNIKIASAHHSLAKQHIESCRRRNIDPYAYLRSVLTRLHEVKRQSV